MCPKGRGSNHRRRNERQKAAVGCYSIKSANHCTGLHPGRDHVGPRVSSHEEKRVVESERATPTKRSFGWWEKIKEWFSEKTDDVVYAVSPKQFEKRINKQIEKKNVAEVKSTRAQTMMRTKRF